jgi:hypothetical protein
MMNVSAGPPRPRGGPPRPPRPTHMLTAAPALLECVNMWQEPSSEP